MSFTKELASYAQEYKLRAVQAAGTKYHPTAEETYRGFQVVQELHDAAVLEGMGEIPTSKLLATDTEENQLMMEFIMNFANRPSFQAGMIHAYGHIAWNSVRD